MLRQRDWAGGFLALAVFMAIVLPAALGANVIDISQKNRKFHPDAVTITRGTVLHIVNDDRVTHHVYVDSPYMKFDSGEEPIGASVDLPFDRVGTFNVLCAIHPTMRLVVTVK
jgi:plastocyanin